MQQIFFSESVTSITIYLSKERLANLIAYNENNKNKNRVRSKLP